MGQQASNVAHNSNDSASSLFLRVAPQLHKSVPASLHSLSISLIRSAQRLRSRAASIRELSQLNRQTLDLLISDLNTTYAHFTFLLPRYLQLKNWQPGLPLI